MGESCEFHFVIHICNGFQHSPMQMLFILDVYYFASHIYMGDNYAFASVQLIPPPPFKADPILQWKFVTQYVFFKGRLHPLD
jgi:hypothetical protein